MALEPGSADAELEHLFFSAEMPAVRDHAPGAAGEVDAEGARAERAERVRRYAVGGVLVVGITALAGALAVQAWARRHPEAPPPDPVVAAPPSAPETPAPAPAEPAPEPAATEPAPSATDRALATEGTPLLGDEVAALAGSEVADPGAPTSPASAAASSTPASPTPVAATSAPPAAAAPAPSPPAAAAPAPSSPAAAAPAPAAAGFEDACRAAMKRDRAADVLRHCPGLLTASPQAGDVSLALARASLERGQARSAIRYAEQALGADPRLVDAYVVKGGAEQLAGSPKRARVAYRRYLELAPRGRHAADLRAILETLPAD